MEKVKLTREQAEAIGDVISYGSKENVIESHIEEGWSIKEYLCLNALSTDEIIRALYIGYEVEETFKVGDWVFDRESVYKIISKHHEDDLNKGMYSKARHATPSEIAEEKQRRWWAKHGRKPWELKIGDIIKKLCSPYDFESLEIPGMDDRYIYAKDNYIINPKTTQMDANYRVVCFAEDRKDVQA